jgi:phosphatidate cytidylyltransferase
VTAVMALSVNLSKRLVAAAVMLPIAAILLYLGPPLMYFWMTALMIGMAWEVNLTSRKNIYVKAIALFYVIAGSGSFLWLGSHADHGLEIRYWIVAMIVLADSLAYFAGRGLGGPKLVPRISPNKTWSGLIGAVIGASLAGIGCSLIFLERIHLPLVGMSVILGFVEQGGDLLESWFKRYHGVKDSSSLIPGHGGLLDRLDGALAVTIILALSNLTMGNLLWLWQ